MYSIIYISLFVIFIIILFIATLLRDAHDNFSRTKVKSMLEQDKELSNVKELSLFKEMSLYTTKLVFTLLPVAVMTLFFNELCLTCNWLMSSALSLLVSFVVIEALNITAYKIVKRHAEKIYLRGQWFNNLFMVILYPLVVISYVINFLIGKLFKDKTEEQTPEEELLDIVDEALEDGDLDHSEGELIRNVLDFGDLKVVDVFTPRVHMVAASSNETVDSILDKFKKSGFSRIPIYENTIDNIIGILNHKDFYNNVLLGKKALKNYIKPAVIVTEYMPLSDLLTLLQSKKAHMAIVKDEYNGTLGLVTMEDTLEELVGDIWDEHDEIIERIITINEDEYNIKGSAELEEVYERIGINLDANEELEHSTISGWVVEKLGRMANVGDIFEFDDYVVTVLNANDKMVVEIKIKKKEIDNT